MRFLLIFVAYVLLGTNAGHSFTANELSQEFDARALTGDEKRFLQAGLALAGTYNAMTDGAWGAGSQRALERYSVAKGGSDFITNSEVLFLAIETYNAFEKHGLVRQYYSGLDMSFLVPTIGLIEGEPSDSFINFELKGTSVKYSLSIGEGSQASDIHKYTERRAIGAPYMLRKPTVWITSSRMSEGVSLYVRSDYRGNAWSTIMVSASDRDGGYLAAISGSIQPGYAPPIGISPGRLASGIETMAVILNENEANGSANVAAAVPPPPAASDPSDQGTQEHLAGFGTGFLVSDAGHYLTNSHVVTGCTSVTIDGLPAIVTASDKAFDLALLQVLPAPALVPASFASKPARLNSDVTVVGFPLPDILGGLNVTRGSVTSLKGIGGDGVRMQISAPVQPGNSGGPVVNASGQVVGIVVSKLDAQLIAEATGDIPQNVNFAIRAEIAKLFLYQNGVEPVEVPEALALPPEDLAEAALGFTRLVICN